MPRLAILVGIILMVTGLVGYFGADRQSVTALIPTVIGLLIAALGLLALLRPGARKHAMHAALAVALLGFLGSLQGIPNFFVLLGGGDVERPWAAVVQTIMAVMTAVLIGAGLRSFVAARKTRTSEAV